MQMLCQIIFLLGILIEIVRVARLLEPRNIYFISEVFIIVNVLTMTSSLVCMISQNVYLICSSSLALTTDLIPIYTKCNNTHLYSNVP